MFLRTILAVPPLILALSALGLMSTTPFTWGVAQHVDVPAWMVPACNVVLSLPAVIIGLFTTRQVLRYTGRPFVTFWLHLPFAVPLFPAAGLFVWLATRITDPRSYDHLADAEGGTFTAPFAVLLLTLVLAAFLHAILYGAAIMYAEAFSEPRRPPRPPDPRWLTSA